MKKLLVFIVLLSHMNFTMFLPQMPEQDCFNSTGQQIDDINSLLEFIDQNLLGNYDATPEDEDDDSGHQFLMAKSFDLISQPIFVDIPANNTIKEYTTFPKYVTGILPNTSLDILSPPPKV
jgi:hypothetical protein